MSERFSTCLCAGIFLVAVSACDTVPLEAPLEVNAVPSRTFGQDEILCRSEARRVGQGHIAMTTAIGGAGGAIGGAVESGDKALAAALVGAAVGAAIGDAEVKQAQRNYLVRCMQQRGHPVLK